MIQIVKTDGASEYAMLDRLKRRSGEINREVTAAVSEILENVRQYGDTSVREYTMQFDGAVPENPEISPEQWEEAMQSRDSDFLYALYKAAENIRDFHERQKQQSWMHTQPNGVILGQRVRGLRRVGIYVPGGTAAYPSSVLMNAIPAKIAGVSEIVMVTPPDKDGRANPDVLAAAKIAGVDRVFLMGGAQAVAALAYGTQTVPQVDKIVGPGNIYVATAKKLLYGTVDIDMIAGPSEILIVADKTANPKFLAADLMSQAEHDRLASAILLTTDAEIAAKTAEELARQVQLLSRREIIEASLRDFGAILVCDTMESALHFANMLAPEHLEMAVENPLEYIGKIDNAGSVFLGHYSPEPLGDYYAGPNHVLPTGGTARFFSPLSVDSFVKKSGFMYYTEDALLEARADIVKLAQTEGLTAHANAVQVRF